MKLSLPKTPKFLTQKVLLIVVATFVLVALFSYGAVRKVQADRVEAVQASQSAIARKEQLKSLEQRITDLEASVQLERSKTAQVCSYVSTLDKNASITRFVTVPVICTSTI